LIPLEALSEQSPETTRLEGGEKTDRETLFDKKKLATSRKKATVPLDRKRIIDARRRDK